MITKKMTSMSRRSTRNSGFAGTSSIISSFAPRGSERLNLRWPIIRLSGPTQIAGFNQFFDDINGTESTRYGFGLDHQLTPNLSLGAEATWRELDEPLFFGNDAVTDKRDEQTHRGYVYWTPWSELALSAEVVYGRIQAQGGATSTMVGVPEKVTTISVPAHARYFWKNGLFAGAGVTYVYQDVHRFDTSTFNEGHDHFVVVDATAGYRLPKRFGVFSLGSRTSSTATSISRMTAIGSFATSPAPVPTSRTSRSSVA